LEQTVFTVFNKLHELLVREIRVHTLDKACGNHHGRRNIVLRRQFEGRMEIFTKTKGTPRTIFVVANTQKARQEFLTVVAQLIARSSIDNVNAEMLPPV